MASLYAGIVEKSNGDVILDIHCVYSAIGKPFWRSENAGKHRSVAHREDAQTEPHSGK